METSCVLVRVTGSNNTSLVFLVFSKPVQLNSEF